MNIYIYICICIYTYTCQSERVRVDWYLRWNLQSEFKIENQSLIFFFCRLLRRCKEADMKVVEKLLAQDQAINSTFAVTSNSHLRGTLGSTLPKSTRYVSGCVCVCI